VSTQFSSLTLEQKFPTGLGGIGPNLDVLLCADQITFAIESKFTEPYTKSKLKTFLKPKYFHGGRDLWAADSNRHRREIKAELEKIAEHGYEREISVRAPHSVSVKPGKKPKKK
jgi:hypothetical protein